MAVGLKPLGFGVNIQTAIQTGVDPLAEAVHAEQLGFEMLTLHRDVLNDRNPSYEMWTLLTWLAAHTSKIKLAPVVLALPYRHPAVLAKMAETLSRLSAGRIILALGGGGPMNEPGIKSLGLVQRHAQEKVEALEEAIDIVQGLWRFSGFSYNGKHFKTEEASIAPKPDRKIPIWLGVYGDRMIDLVGRKADGWISSLPLLPPDLAAQKLAAIRKSAENAGRNPDEITYAYNVPVFVQNEAAYGQGHVAGDAEHVAGDAEHVAGDAEHVAVQLADLARKGFTFLNLWPAGDAAKQRELLIREVIPRVYDLAFSRG